jgi:hypothetical protein
MAVVREELAEEMRRAEETLIAEQRRTAGGN